MRFSYPLSIHSHRCEFVYFEVCFIFVAEICLVREEDELDAEAAPLFCRFMAADAPPPPDVPLDDDCAPLDDGAGAGFIARFADVAKTLFALPFKKHLSILECFLQIYRERFRKLKIRSQIMKYNFLSTSRYWSSLN